MIVAILTAHRALGFFMDWTGTRKGPLVLAIEAYLVIQGAGAFPWIRLLAGAGALPWTD